MSGDAEVGKFRITATQVSLFVAALSLCTAMYQGYLNTQAVGVFSRDVMYRETMRSCREAVELFMEARLRVRRIADNRNNAPAQMLEQFDFEAKRTIARFAAVATYLANFNEASLRERYTVLARELDSIVRDARTKGLAGDDLKKVDEKFYHLNNDCVASVRK